MEAISTDGVSGTMTFIKEHSPTDFAVEQTLPTMRGARTMVLDTKTNHIATQTAEFGTPPPPPPGRRARRPRSHDPGLIHTSLGGEVRVCPLPYR